MNIIDQLNEDKSQMIEAGATPERVVCTRAMQERMEVDAQKLARLKEDEYPAGRITTVHGMKIVVVPDGYIEDSEYFILQGRRGSFQNI